MLTLQIKRNIQSSVVIQTITGVFTVISYLILYLNFISESFASLNPLVYYLCVLTSIFFKPCCVSDFI